MPDRSFRVRTVKAAEASGRHQRRPKGRRSRARSQCARRPSSSDIADSMVSCAKQETAGGTPASVGVPDFVLRRGGVARPLSWLLASGRAGTQAHRGRAMGPSDTGVRRPTGPSLWGLNGCQLFATILPSKPFDSSSGPAEKSSSLVFAAFPLPNLRPHRPSMTIGWPLACRSSPRRAPLFGS